MHVSTLDPLGGAHFRKALGLFASGVTIVTSMDDDGPIGLTCQAFSSVSLDPPLITVIPSRASSSFPRIRETGRFCVNVLSAGQDILCRAIAQPGSAKWDGVDWEESQFGTVRIPRALAWIECRISAEFDGGDHVIVLGEVRGIDLSPEGGGDPLIFFDGAFR